MTEAYDRVEWLTFEVAYKNGFCSFMDRYVSRSDLSVKALKSTLQTYCEGSGQKINFSKSSVFFEAHSSEGRSGTGMMSDSTTCIAK
uniref:Uncharacterized protein n=1 Tax=Setaria italica TaxID=4555 RepID=K4AJV2_SETIT